MQNDYLCGMISKAVKKENLVKDKRIHYCTVDLSHLINSSVLVHQYPLLLEKLGLSF